jgi:hypothetical protein
MAANVLLTRPETSVDHGLVKFVLSQLEREQKVAERIFDLLPQDRATELWALWDEFDADETPRIGQLDVTPAKR